MYHLILEHVKSVKGWVIEDNGEIRIYAPGNWAFCPLTFTYWSMTNKYIPVASGWKAAVYFGLSSEWLYACDFNDTIFNEERKMLLDAVDASKTI